MDSGVDISILPASSTLPLPATADEGNSSLDQNSTMLYLTPLTIIQPNEPITCIDNNLLHNEPLPYSSDTSMDDIP